jgi:alkylhydroperoxidase family enzyme
MKPMFLRDVDENPKPSVFADLIRSLGDRSPQIWRLFAYLPRATEHLAMFTEELLRGPGPLTPGFRELIAAYTSARNHCLF